MNEIIVAVVDNLPLIASAASAVFAGIAMKRNGSTSNKIQAKCKTIVKDDVYQLLEYHKKEVDRLQKCLDYLYTEEGEK